MKKLDTETLGALVKLTIFVVSTTLATGLLVLTIGNISFRSSTDYTADIVDATGVVKGDDVRVSGVKVGSVQGVELVDRRRARVTFSVADDAPVTQATSVEVRYRNLVGQRYLALGQKIGDAERQDPDETIPVDRTSPALDLTVLFNGFKPLFKALTPEDVNRLSYEIVQVFQGEGGTVESLLGNTASLTTTLANRDEVISNLITNLDRTLQNLGDRDEQLSQLIVNFRELVGGLKKDRQAILGSLDDISTLSVQTADLVDGIREPFVRDVKQLKRFAGNLSTRRNQQEIDRGLQVLPIKLREVGRTAIYGSFFNFYLCKFRGDVKLAGSSVTQVQYPPGGGTVGERCNVG